MSWDDDELISVAQMLHGRDIGMATIRKRATKKTEEVTSQVESPDLKKEVATLKKQLEKQQEAFQDIITHIISLGDQLADSAVRMEQDTIDDVYSIGHMKEEFRKLSTKIKKHLPEIKMPEF